MKNLDALKCLVTSSFCSKGKLEARIDESSNVIIEVQNDDEEQQPQKPLRPRLSEPLAFAWHLSRNDNVYRGCSEGASTAEVLQWAFYGQSELNPHLQGYLHFCSKSNNRDVAFQQKQRKAKLAKNLLFLDTVLQPKTFLVGERLTLADTFLAIDMLPLFNVSLNGKPLIKEICPSHNLVHLHRWHKTIVNQKKFLAVYEPSKFQAKLTGSASKSTNESSAKSSGGPKQEVPKILCLHGYRQTSTTFHEKLGAFRKMVGKKCSLKLINAPHLVPQEAHGVPADEQTEDQRGWW